METLESEKRNIVSFLRLLSTEIEVPLFLPHEKVTNSIQNTLSFLHILSLVDITEEKSNLTIKILSSGAFYTIKSLAELIEYDISLVSWEDTISDTKKIKGSHLLELLEKIRISHIPKAKPFKIAESTILIVKALVGQHKEERYLLQFNPKNKLFQLLGIPTDNYSSTDLAIKSLVKKELFRNNFSLGDYRTSFLETITAKIISKKYGVYTGYILHLYSFIINSDRPLKLIDLDYWASIDEIKYGKTNDGVPIQNALFQNNHAFETAGHLNQLPLSTPIVQPQHKTQLLTESTSDHESLTLLLKNEESSSFELKSSLRWDYVDNKINKELEKVIAKTLVGFLNTKGGVLLVGISDSKEVLGLEKDMLTLPKPDSDGLQQLLVSIITNYIGVEFTSFTKIAFLKFSGKIILKIDIEKASSPVFLKDSNRKEFYIRAGNTTRPLDIEEAYHYIARNWRS